MIDVFDALGIVRWQRNDANTDEKASVYQQPLAASSSAADTEVIWCVGEELVDCWENPQDPRWRLLLAMAAAMGASSEVLLPLELEDVQAGMRIWALGVDVPFALALPSLSQMLNDGSAKRRAWQLLCSHKGT